MTHRLNLLSLAVIAAGGIVSAPTRLTATLAPAPSPWQSCCEAKSAFGRIMYCCGDSGCVINSLGCYGW